MSNPLYPIFLKVHELDVLIVGAGYTGYEKLFFLLKNSPNARVTIIAKEISEDVKNLLAKYPNHPIKIEERAFKTTDVLKKSIVIGATNQHSINLEIRAAAKSEGILVNIADTPELCDFYLGSIVTRGNLKVAISTNGKSPTFAKRFRQILEETLPIETDDLLSNLRIIRDRLTGNFEEKVKQLNEITADLVKSK